MLEGEKEKIIFNTFKHTTYTKEELYNRIELLDDKLVDNGKKNNRNQRQFFLF